MDAKSAERWRFVKEKEEEGGIRVRLFASEATPGRFKRVAAISRAGTSKAGGGWWCVVEYCHRDPGTGLPGPWRQEWTHRAGADVARE